MGVSVDISRISNEPQAWISFYETNPFRPQDLVELHMPPFCGMRELNGVRCTVLVAEPRGMRIDIATELLRDYDPHNDCWPLLNPARVSLIMSLKRE